MRKTFIQCCLAVLAAPVLTFMLIGTVALAVGGGGYSMTVTPSTATLEKDGTVKLDAAVTANGSAVASPDIEWSADSSAVTLSSTSGSSITVTAKEVTQNTEVTITAKCDYTYKDDSSASQSDTMTETCTITVKAPAPPVTPSTITLVTSGPFTIEPGATSSPAEIRVTTTGNPQVKWMVVAEGETEGEETSDVVELTTRNGGLTCAVTGKKPGQVQIYAYVGDGTGANQRTDSVRVEVSGIDVKTDTIQVMENEEKNLPAATAYGSARGIVYAANDNYVAMVTGGNKVKGIQVGKTTVVVSDSNGNYKRMIPIEVVADPSTTIEYKTTLKSGEALPFSRLHSDFSSQLGGNVVSVSGLNVPTNQGTLFYRYNSDAEPGYGVASRDTYYRNAKSGQRDLEDVTFVAKPDYMGGQVVIKYMAFTTEGSTYNCSIILEVVSESGASSGISVNTKYNTPVQFDANEFDRVCKERTGSRLDYVIFAQPPARQGTLYTNYSGSGDYGSVVSTTAHYSLRSLDNIWFVPAPGYTGPVTIYYTAHSVGTPGSTYAGQITITVGQDTGVAIGGVSYETSQGVAVTFDDADFNAYCRERLDTAQTVNYLSFDALPSASEGVLYYDYRSSTNTGTRATAGTLYYNGARSPRIDRLTFVPDKDFTGTVKLPFTARTVNGDTFSGDVIVNVRGGSGSGDILYTCTPGRSVSFDDADFNRLCRDLTGSRLNYVEFQSLPNSSDGTLYYNSSAVRTGTRYYNGSSSPRIDNLSFRASSGFSSEVNIPFAGLATSGESFNGVVTISTTSSGSGGGGIRYTTDSKTAAVFDRGDFDDLSREETDRSISTVRFEVPGSSQGYLYRNYRSSSSMGTRITSTTSVSASDLDRIAFVPASGYTGTVYIDFRGTASGDGGTFNGTVEIQVDRSPADVTARYSTRTAPVQLNSGDLSQGSRTLSSVRFTSLPSSGAGYLYYQYTSPTRYGRQASTSASYQASGGSLISDLSFVPRAGYSGTVTIPYIGTNSNGSTFEGEVVVTVSPTYSSSYFSDMGGYSAAQQAAVDYLYDHNITRGLAVGQYGPESRIRRGDFARMVYQAFELSPAGSANTFHDVPSDTYYAEAVNALAAKGVVSGTGGGYYSPNSALTRQDAVCMVQRAMRAVGWSANDGSTGTLSGYGDGSSVAGYAQGAMSLAVQRGYLPMRGGQLSPTQPLTRVEMAELIHRVLTY